MYLLTCIEVSMFLSVVLLLIDLNKPPTVSIKLGVLLFFSASHLQISPPGP